MPLLLGLNIAQLSEKNTEELFLRTTGAVRQTVKTSGCAYVQAHSTLDGALLCHS